MRQRGFTMVEILTIIAIIGIVGGIFFWNYLAYLHRQELRNAALVVYTSLKDTRRLTQKTGVAQTLTWDSGHFQGQALEQGVTITTPFQAGVGFEPPFGTAVTPNNDGFEFELRSPDGTKQWVAMVGITGKAMIKTDGP